MRCSPRSDIRWKTGNTKEIAENEVRRGVATNRTDDNGERAPATRKTHKEARQKIAKTRSSGDSKKSQIDK